MCLKLLALKTYLTKSTHLTCWLPKSPSYRALNTVYVYIYGYHLSLSHTTLKSQCIKFPQSIEARRLIRHIHGMRWGPKRCLNQIRYMTVDGILLVTNWQLVPPMHYTPYTSQLEEKNMTADTHIFVIYTRQTCMSREMSVLVRHQTNSNGFHWNLILTWFETGHAWDNWRPRSCLHLVDAILKQIYYIWIRGVVWWNQIYW